MCLYLFMFFCVFFILLYNYYVNEKKIRALHWLLGSISVREKSKICELNKRLFLKDLYALFTKIIITRTYAPILDFCLKKYSTLIFYQHKRGQSY